MWKVLNLGLHVCCPTTVYTYTWTQAPADRCTRMYITQTCLYTHTHEATRIHSHLHTKMHAHLHIQTHTRWVHTCTQWTSVHFRSAPWAFPEASWIVSNTFFRIHSTGGKCTLRAAMCQAQCLVPGRTQQTNKNPCFSVSLTTKVRDQRHFHGP